MRHTMADGHLIASYLQREREMRLLALKNPGAA